MSGTPRFKVYGAGRGYVATCKDIEAAAQLATFYGAGSTIRDGHRFVLWTEGSDGVGSESYDRVAQVASARIEEAGGVPA